jgi:hypothetical protein
MKREHGWHRAGAYPFGYRGARSRRRFWALFGLLATLGLSRTVSAAPLLVVEFSDADAAAAAKLLDLIDQPAERMRMSAPVEPQSLLEPACARGSQHVVILDSAAQRVHLLRCRDGTLLTRQVATSDVSSTGTTPALRGGAASQAYVMAFVAVELLRLSTQLELPAPAAATQHAAPETPPAGLRADLRLGAVLTWLGAPFEGDFQPALGAGVWLGSPQRSPLWFVAELECVPLGRAQLATSGGRIVLTRTDVAIRSGIAYEIGRISLLAFGRARLARGSAEFLGSGGASSGNWTWGLGAGVEIELRVVGWAKLYASSAVDFAAARNDYRIEGVSVLRDPAQLANVGLGLAFFEEFR